MEKFTDSGEEYAAGSHDCGERGEEGGGPGAANRPLGRSL